ncbi:MAG: ABC transporter ATP-binding protein [Chloroflexi bacterium]|nr:ABC transporter ATP-binding protein [Chloroflexota bacterium]
MPGDVVLEVKDLHTYFFNRRGITKAVDGVSFTLREGETLGIVGESGCGKTMTARSLLRIIPRPAARIVSGEVILDGENLVTMSDEEMRQVRGSKIAMIFQDPQTSLNPVFTIGNQVIEALGTHEGGRNRNLFDRAVDALRSVRVAAPERRMHDFPHQMSGGMKQRVLGAIAIGSAPRVIIADEPTTALDATIQLQYLRLLKDIQEETGMAIIFITHDFGIVARMCDSVAVMYAGRVVERGDVRQLFNDPGHPYTQALMASVPQMERTDRLFAIDGQPPALYAIGNQVIEALGTHEGGRNRNLFDRAVDALRSVRVAAPERRMHDFPHQMSGGMKQRVLGAIAIGSAPRVIIADEPTTALDATIQLQYLRLLKDIQEETGMAIIFITHDFGIVARMCDSVAVMYAGRVVERGDVRQLFNDPGHPYTQALMASVPQMERTDRLFAIDGQPPALYALPDGCRFADRCGHARDICHQEYPQPGEAAEGHVAHCWMLHKVWQDAVPVTAEAG